MAKHHIKKNEMINGRISLLFFCLLLFGGLLWLVRTAQYRYDLIFRPMLIWLLPTLFGVAAITFAVLLIVWIKKGRPHSEKLVNLPFFIALTVPLMAAFLFPWLTLFSIGFQFYSLATELVFFAALGGFIGYIAYAKISRAALLPAVSNTLNILVLYYFYSRHLSPTSFFLNTEEFNYLKGWELGLLLIALIIVFHLATVLLFRKTANAQWLWSHLSPAALTVILLGLHSLIELPILWTRITVFGGMGLMALWFIVWCILKKRKKL